GVGPGSALRCQGRARSSRPRSGSPSHLVGPERPCRTPPGPARQSTENQGTGPPPPAGLYPPGPSDTPPRGLRPKKRLRRTNPAGAYTRIAGRGPVVPGHRSPGSLSANGVPTNPHRARRNAPGTRSATGFLRLVGGGDILRRRGPVGPRDLERAPERAVDK